MHTARTFRWWGLYALLPLMIGLIALDDETPMSETWHLVLLVAIALVICGLALAWVERHAGLVETDGIDRSSTYHILLNTSDGLTPMTITQEMPAAQENRPAAEQATEARSPTSRALAAEARDLR